MKNEFKKIRRIALALILAITNLAPALAGSRSGAEKPDSSSKVLNGTVIDTLNNKVRLLSYKENVLNGKFEIRDLKTGIFTTGNYSSGNLDGDWQKKRTLSGREILLEQCRFDNGNMEGYFYYFHLESGNRKSKIRYDADGKTVLERWDYDVNGNLKKHILTLEKGKCLDVTHYYPGKETLRKKTFKVTSKGKYYGKVTEYDTTGIPTRTWNCKKGKCKFVPPAEG